MLQKKTSGGVPVDRDVETGQAVHVVTYQFELNG